MAIEIQPIQQKKNHKGFFVLLAIIAVVIFVAYALTQKEKQLSSGTTGLTLNERDAIVKAFEENTNTPLTEAERKETAASVSAASKTQKPLTTEQKEAIINQFAN